jgi:hypothetical protein
MAKWSWRPAEALSMSRRSSAGRSASTGIVAPAGA